MVSVRYLSNMWVLYVVSGLAVFCLAEPCAILFFVSLVFPFTVLHLNVMPSISSFLFFLEYFFSVFHFFYVWIVL